LLALHRYSLQVEVRHVWAHIAALGHVQDAIKLAHLIERAWGVRCRVVDRATSKVVYVTGEAKKKEEIVGTFRTI
jgi:hypothetical protein